MRRAAVSAVVIGLHFLVALLLLRERARHADDLAVDAPAITWLILPDSLPDDTQRAREAPVPDGRRTRSNLAESAISTVTGTDSGNAPLAVDWADAAERAAATAASEDSGRSVTDVPRRRVKPFAWNKAATERFSFPLSGGTAIRLGDHCEIVLLPLPVGGCALGKIEPRGDLFDGMERPVEFGDWKK